jgi:hypothetical protein
MLLGLLTENKTVMTIIVNVSFSLEILAVFIIIVARFNV